MRVALALGLVFACLVALSVATATAREIHVDNQRGNDHNDGRLLAGVVPRGGPVRSIKQALWLAEPHDHIIITNTGEPYRESLFLMGNRHSRSEHGPLVIEGNGATLDGTGTIRPDAWTWEREDIFSFRSAHLYYQQLFEGDRTLVRRSPPVPDGGPPVMAPRQWCLSAGKLFFCVEPGKLPQDYPLSCCRLDTGITLEYVRGVVIRNFVVRGFHYDGVRVVDSRDVRLQNITSRSNGRSGVSGRGSARVELLDCHWSENGSESILSEEFSQLRQTASP